MDRDVARSSLFLVNDSATYESLQKLISHKISIQQTFLETTKDTQKIFEVQGSIAELRRMQHLREEVLEAAK